VNINPNKALSLKKHPNVVFPESITLQMHSRLSIAIVILVTPFAIYHFINQNYFIGSIVSLIVGIFLFFSSIITKKRPSYSKFTFWIFVPAAISLLAYVTFQYGLMGALWCFPFIIGIYCTLPEKRAYIANFIFLLFMIPIIWMNVDQATAMRAIASLILTNAFTGILINAFNKQQAKLEKLVVTDPLTSLFNRSLLEDTLNQAIEQFDRTQIPMSIAIFDLDNFKEINDSMGHTIGDNVLISVAKTFKKRCRKVDRIFRLGGDEFLVFLYNTSKKQSIKITEELRQKISTIEVAPNFKVSTSVGIANLEKDETWQSWMRRCDSKLYESKKLGRNRITV